MKHRPFALDELRAYLVEVFPQIWSRGDYAIEEVGPMSATVRLAYHLDHLRPGGTISGPAMFARAIWRSISRSCTRSVG
jgi:hypothetical protein